MALPDRHATVRVLPGPQADYFTADALEILQSAPYTIAHDSDRMGFRLAGPAAHTRRSADMISDATPLGALQVPASGQPILLMADRQTTGGYPKIATVISADIDCRPAGAGRLGRLRRLHPRRRDGGADRPGTSADGARGPSIVSEFAAALRRRWATAG